MKRNLYIIATTSRSGSTYLCQLLASTRRLGEPKEYYNPPVKARFQERWNAADDLTYFRELLTRTSTANGVCGVKLATSALVDMRAQLGPVFELLRPVYIWLRRRDALRQAISLYRASATGHWHWPAAAQRPRACPPFDAQRINECRRRIEQANDEWESCFAAGRIDPLMLWYEDVAADPRASVAAVCRRVGVDARDLPPLKSKLRVMRDGVTDHWVKRMRLSHAVHARGAMPP